VGIFRQTHVVVVERIHGRPLIGRFAGIEDRCVLLGRVIDRDERWSPLSTMPEPNAPSAAQ
jgi:hypothetical protein